MRDACGGAPGNRPVMPDDHSELVPPLPIPNRTVKRLSADDSAATSVKVGHRQAVTPENPRRPTATGVFAFGAHIGDGHGSACACSEPLPMENPLAFRNVHGCESCSPVMLESPIYLLLRVATHS